MNARTHLSPCLLMAILTCAAATRADDWPQWRGVRRDGISQETRWRDRWDDEAPLVSWRTNVGTGFSSLAIAEGRVFTIGNRENEDTVYCLDAATGKQVWQHSYECSLGDNFFEGGPTSTPTVDGNFVYTLSRQGDAFCFDSATGTIRWSVNVAERADVRVPGWGFAASPIIHGDLLILGVGETGTALSKETGKILWTSADADAGYATPLPFHDGDRTLAIIASGKHYHAIDLSSGEELWRHRWLTRFGCNAAEPILDGRRLFISSGYNRGSALLKLTDDAPEVIWSSRAFQNQFTSSVLLDGYLYGVDGDTTGERSLKCVEFGTGNVVWTESGFGTATLMSANGRLIILSESGELVVATASPTMFEVLGRTNVLDGKCWTVPVLANGFVYCRNARGDMACIDLRRTP